MPEPKVTTEQTPVVGNVQSDEINNTQPVDDTTHKTNETEEERVELSAKDLKTLQNKAKDFDAIVAKKATNKFMEKHADQVAPAVDEDALLAKATEKALETMRAEQEVKDTASRNVNLKVSLDAIQQKYPFLKGEQLAKVSESFDYGSALSVEQLSAKLEATVREVLPTEYEESLKAEITKKILNGDAKLNLGGIGSGGIAPKESNSLTEEQKISQKYVSNLPKRFKY